MTSLRPNQLYPLRELLMVVRENTSLPIGISPYLGRKCLNPEAVAEAFRDMQFLEQEYFLVLHLDTGKRHKGLVVARVSSLSQTLAHPREIFRLAVLNGASVIIAIHNHPSGQAEPCPEDQRITDQLRAGGRILGIELADHIIIAGEKHYSFAVDGAWAR